MTNFVTLTTDINGTLTYTKDEFIKEVICFIEFAINEKEYDIDDLDAIFILQDITNRLGVTEFDVSVEAMTCINEQLELYRNKFKGVK